MKNIVRRLKMRKSASEQKRSSIDPIKAYKARLEIGIYAWLLDLIEKELKAEQAATTPEATAPEATAAEKTTIAEPVAQIGVQAV